MIAVHTTPQLPGALLAIALAFQLTDAYQLTERYGLPTVAVIAVAAYFRRKETADDKKLDQYRSETIAILKEQAAYQRQQMLDNKIDKLQTQRVRDESRKHTESDGKGS